MSKMLLILILILAFAAASQAQSPAALWQQQAEIEIEPGTPYPSAEKIRRIANAYADLYLTNPDAYKWAGLAALETCNIHAQLRNWFLAPAAAANADETLITQRTLDGVTAVYDSLYWQHLAYQDEGLAALENWSAEIPVDLLNGWRMIDQGLQGADFELVWQGNAELLRYVEGQVLQPVTYDGAETAWDNTAVWPPWVLSSPAPGVSDFLWEAGSMANFDERWAWITGKIVPAWRGFDGFLTAYRTEIQDKCGLVIGVDILTANTKTHLDQVLREPVEILPTSTPAGLIAPTLALSIGLEVQIVSLEPAFPTRTAPSMRAPILNDVLRSDRATIIDGPQVVSEMSDRGIPQDFTWWRIRSASGAEGWIQESYYGEPILIAYDPANPLPPVSCILSTLQPANIRSGPGINFEQVASRTGDGQVLAANGQFGNLTKSDEHWWRLYDGFWIRNDQVRESGDCNSLPVIAR